MSAGTRTQVSKVHCSESSSGYGKGMIWRKILNVESGDSVKIGQLTAWETRHEALGCSEFP